MKIGDVLNKQNYTEGSIWCTKNNAEIKLIDGKYTIVEKQPKPEPTLEERVARLEAETGLTRIMREGILAEGSLYSDYAKAKAQEIEDLAAELRTAEKASEVGEGWNG